MTLAKMLGGYSECRNQALAAAFAYMNLIENWGSRMKRFVGELKAAGLREPELIEWPNALRVNVFRKVVDGPGKGCPQKADRPKKRPLNRPEKRPLKEVLLAVIRACPGVTHPQLVKLSKKGRTVVTAALAVLRNEGKRVSREQEGRRVSCGGHESQ